MSRNESGMLPIANPSVIYRSLADGAVLLSTRDEVYFGLNAVGARVWELLPPARSTFDELCTAIAAEYPDADPAEIRADVRELLDELVSHGLLQANDAQRGDGDSQAQPSA